MPRGIAALAVVAAAAWAVWTVGESDRSLQRSLLTLLGLNYLYLGFSTHTTPSIAHPAWLVLDHPFRYDDDINRGLATTFVLLSPARMLSVAIAELVFRRWLPTIEQLAETLYRAADKGAVDYALAPSLAESTESLGDSQSSESESATFQRSLRRDNRQTVIFALTAMAAVLSLAMQLLGTPALAPLSLALVVEVLVRAAPMMTDWHGLAHPSFFHVHLSRHRPEFDRQGQQGLEIAADSAPVLLRGLLAAALLLWINLPLR